ncbi:outer membrane lipid asymmetry maintenance protein MlaD [Fodinicurvata sediminis]|uniref:outer membrane lipid asymmetry maintenance protein MlaD n=1 Tax=Fodinicurvata sediminis TaxID=1121832 RepID=UPI0003B76CF9|nr:outer membrane lipid asymmetry maintenance protein MlaD [Fodinicurvata sediminis]
MRRNIIETVMGGVVILIAAAFLIFAFNASDFPGSSSGYSVVADFDNASGLNTGSEVRMSGVPVGKVVHRELDEDTFLARVTLSINDGVELPADTSAKITGDGLMGSNYISLSPGGAEDNIQPGGRIEYTQGAMNLMDLIGRFVFGGAGGGSDSGAGTDGGSNGDSDDNPFSSGAL